METAKLASTQFDCISTRQELKALTLLAASDVKFSCHRVKSCSTGCPKVDKLTKLVFPHFSMLYTIQGVSMPCMVNN